MKSIEYHILCNKCNYMFWSAEAFPKICPKCKCALLR